MAARLLPLCRGDHWSPAVPQIQIAALEGASADAQNPLTRSRGSSPKGRAFGYGKFQLYRNLSDPLLAVAYGSQKALPLGELPRKRVRGFCASADAPLGAPNSSSTPSSNYCNKKPQALVGLRFRFVYEGSQLIHPASSRGRRGRSSALSCRRRCRCSRL